MAAVLLLLLQVCFIHKTRGQITVHGVAPGFRSIKSSPNPCRARCPMLLDEIKVNNLNAQGSPCLRSDTQSLLPSSFPLFPEVNEINR